jgi:transcriptional regulator with XRE-family HTH domain
MPNPNDLDPTKSPEAYFGSELRKYRKESGLSQAQLAGRTGYAVSTISMAENGNRIPTDDFVQKCDEKLELEGALLRLKAMIDNMAAQIPTWFRGWVETERNADNLRTWEPLIVPGLLQTESYARAVMQGKPRVSPDSVEEGVAKRMERQQLLHRDNPPRFWVVLDEGVLARPIGSAAIMVEQLHHLLEHAKLTHITIQVLPHSAMSTTGLLGGFVVAEGPGLPDTVYLESALRGGIVDAPDDVRAVRTWYDAIRADAMSQGESLKVITEKREQWSRN